jgi:hypothetical protein
LEAGDFFQRERVGGKLLDRLFNRLRSGLAMTTGMAARPSRLPAAETAAPFRRLRSIPPYAAGSGHEAENWLHRQLAGWRAVEALGFEASDSPTAVRVIGHESFDDIVDALVFDDCGP